MADLATYAALAEIFGVVTIIVAAIFGVIQFREFRRRRMAQTAAELCSQFTKPEFARAVTLLKNLPDGTTHDELIERGSEYEDAAQLVGMAFETMGLLVHEDIACFPMTQELTGGLVIMMWRKIGGWIKGTREKQKSPQFGEWVQWLSERFEEDEPNTTPAYEEFASWKPPR